MRSSAVRLVLYAIARRGGTIIAAGGSIVGQAEARTGTHFEAPLIGDPNGAQLEVSVAGTA